MGIAATSAGIARVPFGIFLVLSLSTLPFGARLTRRVGVRGGEPFAEKNMRPQIEFRARSDSVRTERALAAL